MIFSAPPVQESIQLGFGEGAPKKAHCITESFLLTELANSVCFTQRLLRKIFKNIPQLGSIHPNFVDVRRAVGMSILCAASLLQEVSGLSLLLLGMDRSDLGHANSKPEGKLMVAFKNTPIVALRDSQGHLE